jgi:hypothetical protein
MSSPKNTSPPALITEKEASKDEANNNKDLIVELENLSKEKDSLTKALVR